jgi:hypothetical protein
VAYLHDKGAFPLLRAFLDCGMSYGAGENTVKGEATGDRGTGRGQQRDCGTRKGV